jgi:ribosomal protein L11 methyltransferase
VTWWAIDVRTPAERRDSLGAWLVARTGQAVEERDDGTLVAFTPDERAADALLAELGGEVAARRRLVDDPDWSTRWRDGIGIKRVGRLTVIPSWLPEAAKPDELTIVLDPETAFGSAEHGSTRVALTLLGRFVSPGDRVLDLGSGSGVLTIAAVKLGAARATGIEIDGEANAIAARNALRNRVAPGVKFLEGDAAVLAPLVGPVDLVVSNILRSVNGALLPVISAALRQHGLAIFSGMEWAEADDFRRSLDHAGFAVVEDAEDAGWWGVAAKHPG